MSSKEKQRRQWQRPASLERADDDNQVLTFKSGSESGGAGRADPDLKRTHGLAKPEAKPSGRGPKAGSGGRGSRSNERERQIASAAPLMIAPVPHLALPTPDPTTPDHTAAPDQNVAT
jgi:hypothetical protein